MSAHGYDNEESFESRGASEEMELLMGADGEQEAAAAAVDDAVAADLNEDEELLADGGGGEGGEEAEEGVEGERPPEEERGDSEEQREEEEEQEEEDLGHLDDLDNNSDEMHEEVDQREDGSEEREEEEEMMEGDERLDEDDQLSSEHEEKDYDGDEEEEEMDIKQEDEEEDSSRRSTRSTRASLGFRDVRGMGDEELDEELAALNEDAEDEEEEEEDDEEGEGQGEYGDEEKKNNKGKEDSNHPTLLAQAGEGIIHVGSEYQATIAEPDGERKSAREDEDRDTALWIPPAGGLNDDELVEFCEEAMGIYMLSFDRALYILQNSGYDYKKALETIACRKTVKEEWSEDDNLLFRQAYALYGKNFARIRQTMPHRSMSSIIHHYYSTKKQQDYKSLIDSKIDSMGYHIEDSQKERQYLSEEGKCENCQETVKRLFLIDESKQCNTCLLYFKLMLKPRPVPKEELPEGGPKRRAPLDAEFMDIVDDFLKLAEHVPEPREPAVKRLRTGTAGVHMSVCVFQSRKTKVHEKMRQTEHEIMNVRTRIVRIHQGILAQRAELADRANFDKLRASIEKDKTDTTDKGRVRMQYSWTDQEKITAFHCFVRYGRDFEAVAEVVGTKTPDMVKSLYTELKEDIDKIIDDAEAEDAVEAAAADKSAILGASAWRPAAPIEVVDIE